MKLFRLKREEWLPAAIFLVALLFFHWLIVSKFWILFADYYHADSWRIFMRNYHMSGFDPISYHVLTDWHQGFSIVRHPLLAFFLYPFYLLNQLLWTITGANCAQLIMAAMLLFSGFYSFVFIHRTLREVVGVGRTDATMLSFFLFGSAYILLSLIVADHFCPSLFLLTLTIYLSGHKIKAGHTFSRWQMLLLFTLTAGVTLSNGIITWLCVWLTNGRNFFRPKTFVPAFTLSLALLGFGIFVNAKWGNDEATEVVGKWVDMQTPRVDTMVENLFGESIQLHKKQLLGDVLMKRPVIVRYSWLAQYVVEGVIVVLFLWGVWRARRERFLHLLMACFAYALLLHIVVGFAINEVYIMTCHWLWVLPLAMGYLLVVPLNENGIQKNLKRHRCERIFVRFMLWPITLYLWIYHTCLLYPYLTWPPSY
ncbi:MAG: hypothetical protein K5893_08380 [Prevotella sp.]|nr:hypothetical protein [Prevotella sp.]